MVFMKLFAYFFMQPLFDPIFDRTTAVCFMKDTPENLRKIQKNRRKTSGKTARPVRYDIAFILETASLRRK